MRGAYQYCQGPTRSIAKMRVSLVKRQTGPYQMDYEYVSLARKSDFPFECWCYYLYASARDEQFRKEFCLVYLVAKRGGHLRKFLVRGVYQDVQERYERLCETVSWR